MIDGKRNGIFLPIIGVLSVLIPVLVAILLFKPTAFSSGLDVSFLPHLNAVFNTATAVCLAIGYYFIKNKNIALHRTMMIAAFVLSSLFLISYVIYHANAESTKFGGVGAIRYLYFFLLLSHILLAIVIVYFALKSLYFGLTKQYEKHKKVSRWTFPIWMYVALTGVIVYLMISPYYR
jgi:putative membrane protein